MKTKKKTCDTILPNDSGSDYRCTEKKGHKDDHCDSRHPFSWPQDVTHLTQGRKIQKAGS